MIYVCPFCGIDLEYPIGDGLGSCINCKKTFQTNGLCNILSIWWMLHKHHIDMPRLKHQYNLSEFEMNIAIALYDYGYSYDEIILNLKKLGLNIK